MSLPQHAIEALPPSTAHAIRSSLIITSLPVCALELIHNALDAQATNVEVAISWPRWSVRVTDNGYGIERRDLKKVGGRNVTSKLATTEIGTPGAVETYGFRGEALASIADASLLEIVSRARSSKETFMAVIRGGTRTYDGPAKHSKRNSSGTVVHVRDLFYKWPVRRKPYLDDGHSGAPRSSILRDTESLKRDIEALALIHPDVTFSLIDLDKEPGKEKLLRISKTVSSLATFKALFVDHEKATFGGADETDGDLSISGFLSESASHTKRLQFIYVNKRPIEVCDIHKEINSLFNRSSFARLAQLDAPDPLIPSPTKPGRRTSTRQSPRRSLSARHPIFLLNISLPPERVDVFLEPEKRVVQFEDEAGVMDLVRRVVLRFLRESGFVSEERRRKGDDEVMEVDGRSGIGGNASPRPSSSRRVGRMIEGRSAHSLPVAMRFPSSTLIEHTKRRAEGSVPELICDTKDDGDEPLKWVDPSTGRLYNIDRRTGNSWPAATRPNPNFDGSPVDPGPGDNSVIGAGRSSLKRRLLEEDEDEDEDGDEGVGVSPQSVPEWISRALKDWKNPIFGIAEKAIPSLRTGNTASLVATDACDLKHHHHCGDHNGDKAMTAFSFGRGRRSSDLDLSAESLKRAEFIAQVDRKFLLCRIPTAPRVDDDDDRKRTSKGSADSADSLFLIDQHAADERVRVERLFEDLVEGEMGVYVFPDPLPVLLTDREYGELSNHLDSFTEWGFGVDLEPTTTTESTGHSKGKKVKNVYGQVYVRHVPSVVADRLKRKDEGQVLSQLIKHYLAEISLRGGGGGSKRFRQKKVVEGEKGVEGQGWLNAIRNAPGILVELINSKACRGAIMFNDPLTDDQCKRLIAQLAETRFPFQCAHGRPSLVPLFNVGQVATGQGVQVARRELRWENLMSGVDSAAGHSGSSSL